MLLFIVLAVRPQKPAIPVGLGPAERVELVISHDGERRTGGTPAFGNMKHFPLLWSAIDKIANKNYLAIRMTKNALILAIIHLLQ
jgi:hypothetical protein